MRSRFHGQRTSRGHGDEGDKLGEVQIRCFQSSVCFLLAICLARYVFSDVPHTGAVTVSEQSFLEEYF